MNKSVRSRRSLRFGMLLLGFVFILTPSVNLVDPLPDCIGYLLILHAISKAADTAPYFEDARDRFIKLFWISLSKIGALIVMMTIYSGDLNQRSIITVFAVVYAIVELMYLIPATEMLFEGFFYLGVRFGCDAAIARDGRCHPEQLARFLHAVLVIHAICACAPELALVPISDGDEQSLAAAMLRAYPFLALLAFLLSLVLGIMLLRRLSRYFKRMRADGTAERLISEFAAERRELLYRRGERRSIRLASVLLILGSLLGADLVLDQINVLPDLLSALCLIAFLRAVGARVKGCRIGTAIAVLYGIASVVAYALSVRFFTKYDILSLYDRDGEALALYSRYLNLSYLELGLSILLSLVLVTVLIRLVPHVANSIGEQDSLQTQRLRKSMKREAILWGLLRSLSAVAWVVYILLSQYTKNILLDTSIGGAPTISSNVPLVDGLWIVPPLLSLLELCVALHLTSRFRTESELTYAEL